MRNYSFSLCSLLFLGILSSCNNIEPEIAPKDDKGFVLRASYAEGQLTRTSFGVFTTSGKDAELLWNEDDELSFFYSSQEDSPLRMQTGCAGKSAKFSFVDEESADLIDEIISSDRYYGLYPFDKNASVSFSSSVIKTSVPSSQRAIDGTFDPLSFLAVAYSDTIVAGDESVELNMAFYNVCSGFCFTLQDPSDYASIEFSGNEGEAVCGDVEISMSNPSEPSVRPKGNNNKTITLTAPDGGFKQGVRYYISILPGDFASGFTVRFLNSAEKEIKKCVCSSFESFERSEFAFKEDVDDPDVLASINAGVPLASENESANCYVVSAPGTYKFPLVRGIDPKFALNGVDVVEVLWETVNTSSAPSVGSVINGVEIKKNQVFFTVPDPVMDGNALIAAKTTAGDILWSWHIWVCDSYNPDASAQRLVGKPTRMLDRNLGALAASSASALSNGLFYQWGRKDPFPGAAARFVSSDSNAILFSTTSLALKLEPCSASVTVDYAVAHPDVYFTSTDGHWLYSEINTLWDKKKTNYDPCPIGWKIPNCYSYTTAGHNADEEAWNVGAANYERVQSASAGYGASFRLEGGGYAWYPNTGYIGTDGRLVMVGQYSIYWSCNPMGGNTFGLELSQDMSGQYTLDPYKGGKYRGEGHAVRCIEDK